MPPSSPGGRPTCEPPEPLQSDADPPQRLLGRVEGDGVCACLLNVDLQVVLQVLPNSWHRMEWLRKKMVNTGASPSLQSIYLLSRFLSVLAPADELSTSVTTSTVFDESGPLSNAKATCPAAPSTAATQAPLTSPSLQHPPRTGPAILAVGRRPVVSPMLSPPVCQRRKQSQHAVRTRLELIQTQAHREQPGHRPLPQASRGKLPGKGQPLLYGG